jgi:LAO/AO transport system kinase
MLCSAVDNEGIGEVWDAAVARRDGLAASGELDERRSLQAKHWLWAEIQDRLLAQITDDPETAARIPELEQLVAEGRVSPSAAAAELLGERAARRPGPPRTTDVSSREASPPAD